MDKSSKDPRDNVVALASFSATPDAAHLDGIKVTLNNIQSLEFVGDSGLEVTLTNGRVVELLSKDIQGILSNIVVSRNLDCDERSAAAQSTFDPQDLEPSNTQVPKSAIKVGSLTLIQDSFRCSWKGEVVKLTAAEFQLLLALVKRPGDVKSRAQLIDEAFGDDFSGFDRAIDSYIKRIRLKFKALDPGFAQIESLYGIGYRYLVDRGSG